MNTTPTNPTALPVTPMSRRRLLAGLAGTLVAVPAFAAVLAACGDPDDEPAGTTPDTSGTTTPGSTPGTGADGSIEHGTDATAAIIRLSYEGGFVAPDTLFVNVPAVVVAGDGRVYSPAPVTAIYPGPLVQPYTVRTISEAGIQMLLADASAQGLLGAAPDYSAEMMIADAPDTVVRIAAGGGTYEHRAYALGMGIDSAGNPADESTEPRRKLWAFVQQLTDLPATVGAAALGAESLFTPAAYRLRATAVDEASLGGLDVEPTFVDWPSSTGVSLAASAECASATAEQIGTLFADATQTTYFREGGTTYQLAVAVVLPGDAGC
ncbi:MAG: hypothetical protein U0Q03_07905 [Acidimicrobiales bacterium]